MLEESPSIEKVFQESPSLEKVFQNNLSDPSAIYLILDRYENMVEEDDAFMQEILGKLDTMEVSWLRPWYQELESSILKYTVKDRPDHPDQYRTDRFTKEEDKALWKNWKTFLKEYKLPNKPQSFGRWRNMEKNKRKTCPFERARGIVTVHLARGLQRNLRQVYTHFVNEYAYPVKGPYSPLEEQIMEVCFDHYREKSIMILSKVLGRESRGIYGRFEIFTNGKGEKETRVKWNLELATKLLKSLVQHFGESFEELKDKRIERDVWRKVQEDMGIPYDRLRRFWYRKLHLQCFLQESLTTKDVNRKIYKILVKSQYKRWLDIRWTEIVKKFPSGCTAVFLHICASRFIAKFCSNFPRQKLKQILEVWDQNKNRVSNRRLKLVRFDLEGKLMFYRENGAPCDESVVQ